MRSYILNLTLPGLLALASFAGAQAPGPDLAKMSNLAFGWVSMSGVDPTLEMLTSFAPNTMALRDAGYRSGGEAVSGQLTFGDLEVASNFGSAMAAVGPGVLRICQYKYDSNLANIAGLPGMPARTGGEAIELSYAQHVGEHTTVGVSLVPQDSSSVNMVLGGINMVESRSETEFGARAGAVVDLPHDVKVGANYSYQRDSGTTRLNPLLTGAPDWIELRGNFITRCSTVGASKKLGEKTTVYTSYQNITATGLSEGSRSADLVWFGVTHNFTKDFAVRANYLDGGGNYSVMWRSPIGIVNLAYTQGALKNAEEILGSGDAVFAALAVAF
jgi:hypothetical protein